MADIAVVFGWPASELWEMEIDELMDWHKRAIKRLGVKGLTRA